MRVKELQQRFFLRLTTLITLTACFFLLSLASLGALNLSKVLSLWGEEVQVSAYLSMSLAPSETDQLREKILKDPRVSRVDLISQEEALEDFRVQMASYAPDLVSQPDLFSLIPPSLQITVNEDFTSATAVGQIASSIEKLAGIDEVRYGQQWIEKYGAFLSVIRQGTGSLWVILILASLMVIGNSIRASVEARRSEVEVLELIGATPWMIRKPFLAEGILLGLGSTALALAGSAFCYLAIKRFFAQELQFLQLSQHFSFLSLAMIIGFLCLGALLGGIAAYLCVRRLNSGFAAAGGVE